MASACVNNIGTSPGYSSYGWTTSRASLSREDERYPSNERSPDADSPENQDPVDFEFRLEDPVTTISADELFSNGKLVPLKFSGTTSQKPMTTTMKTEKSPEMVKSCPKLEMEISDVDPYLFSPKAPRCTTRWRELLGLKRLAKTQESSLSPSTSLKTTPFLLSSSSSPSSKMTTLLSSSSPNPKTSSFKHFLHRSSKSSLASSSSLSSSSDASSLNHPLLMKDPDNSESLSVSSSRLSLSSSSSSGHELDDLPRLSLDLEKKPGPNPFAPARSLGLNPNQPRMRLAKPRPSTDGRSPIRRRHHTTAAEDQPAGPRRVTVTADSPRLNASGKLVFHGLERSSSSPGSFNGGPRLKHNHGMPRSYSANVRITPVLNVPVCSLRGSSKSGLLFGQLFSSSSSSSSSSSVSASVNRGQLHSNTKNRTNRT